MTVVTKETVCSNALHLIGANTIQSFEDETPEADFCNRIYEQEVLGLISRRPWTFAMKQGTATLLGSSPNRRWQSIHKLPNDILRLHAVFENDTPVLTFNKYGDELYNDSTENVIDIDYTYYKPEGEWPPYFVTLVQYHMAWLAGSALAQNADLVSQWYAVTYNESPGQPKGQYWIAAAADAQTKPARRVRPSRFAAGRRRQF